MQEAGALSSRSNVSDLLNFKLALWLLRYLHCHWSDQESAMKSSALRTLESEMHHFPQDILAGELQNTTANNDRLPLFALVLLNIQKCPDAFVCSSLQTSFLFWRMHQVFISLLLRLPLLKLICCRENIYHNYLKISVMIIDKKKHEDLWIGKLPTSQSHTQNTEFYVTQSLTLDSLIYSNSWVLIVLFFASSRNGLKPWFSTGGQWPKGG